MRAPRRLIPTERIGFSVGVGALVPFLTIVVASCSAESLLAPHMFLAPFVSGFSASITFGSIERRGIRPLFLVSFLAFIAYCCVLLTVGRFLAFGVNQGMGIAIYLSLFSPFILASLIVLGVGAVFGGVASLMAGR